MAGVNFKSMKKQTREQFVTFVGILIVYASVQLLIAGGMSSLMGGGALLGFDVYLLDCCCQSESLRRLFGRLKSWSCGLYVCRCVLRCAHNKAAAGRHCK